MTALHRAARNNRLELHKVLNGANANLNKRNDAVQSPLHLAAQGGLNGAVQRIFDAGTAPACRDDNNRAPADCAATEEIAQLLPDS
jgi:ankyrin repeat protein